MEDTITDDVILPDEGAAEPAVPTVEEPQSPAAQEPAEPTQTEAEGDEASVPEAEDKLKSFAKGQGIEDISELSDREQRLLKIAYDNNAEFQRNRQKASELEKTLSQGVAQDIQAARESGNTDLVDQLAAEVQGLKLAQNVNAFFAATPEAKALEAKMTELVTERPEIGTLVKTGYLSLPDLYNLARGADTQRDQDLKQQGGKEALQKVATKQQAKAVVGNATSSEINPPEEDPFLAGFEAEG